MRDDAARVGCTDPFVNCRKLPLLYRNEVAHRLLDDPRLRAVEGSSDGSDLIIKPGVSRTLTGRFCSFLVWFPTLKLASL